MQFMNSPLHLTLLRQCNIFHPEHQALPKELSSPTPDHPLVYYHHSPGISELKFAIEENKSKDSTHIWGANKQGRMMTTFQTAFVQH